MNNKRVLVIDDEDFIRDLVGEFLDIEGIPCDEAVDEASSLELISQNHYDLILLDRNLGKTTAEEVITAIRKIDTQVPVVMLTGDPQYSPERFKKIGGNGVIYKPFQVDIFMKQVSSFLRP